MKIKYKQQGYIYLFLFFIIFIGFVIAFIFNREKILKTQIGESRQVAYTRAIDEYISGNQLTVTQMDSLNLLLSCFPDSLSLTIIGQDGTIFFNNPTINSEIEKNDRQLPEIAKAFLYGNGWNIRKSLVSNRVYMYYAVYNGDYIIHTALPYDEEIKSLMQLDKIPIIFLCFVVFSFFLFWILIYIYHKKSIRRLHDFIVSLIQNKTNSVIVPDSFPDTSLGKLELLIAELCNKVEMNQKMSILEREKLLEHFHYSDEGIAFFKPSFENISTNTHFIQYLNMLLNEPTFDVCDLFKSPVFSDVLHFIENQKNKNVFNGKLYSNGHQFRVRVIIFDDRSFEIIIRNISAAEKADFDRARLTNNVAHELRTPVTSIMGYLETLVVNENLDEKKRKEFIHKAYNQTVRLSEIIQDVVLLSKTATAPLSFLIEDINIPELLKDMIDIDVRENIEKRKVTVMVSVPENVVVRGNRTLIQSIFYNLCINALKYAGEGITITIRNYMEDDDYYYFSFSDNGIGIDNKHLEHIFERFYRITEGRTRDKGGSGLGLAIVKDAVNFHKGVILAKNRAEKGLEFLFTLQKK